MIPETFYIRSIFILNLFESYRNPGFQPIPSFAGSQSGPMGLGPLGRDAGSIADGAAAGDGGGGSGCGNGGGGDSGGAGDGGGSVGRRRCNAGACRRHRMASRDHPLPGGGGDVQRTSPSNRAQVAFLADRNQHSPRDIAANDPLPEMFAVGEVVEVEYEDESSLTKTNWYVFWFSSFFPHPSDFIDLMFRH
jgi:hypothetical protein